jgi:hypothetical protein
MILLQQKFETKESRDGHEAGWSSSLRRLASMAG